MVEKYFPLVATGELPFHEETPTAATRTSMLLKLIAMKQGKSGTVVLTKNKIWE
jgi:hypothetical protein